MTEEKTHERRDKRKTLEMGGNDLSNVRKIKLKKTKYGEKEKSK